MCVIHIFPKGAISALLYKWLCFKSYLSPLYRDQGMLLYFSFFVKNSYKEGIGYPASAMGHLVAIDRSKRQVAIYSIVVSEVGVQSTLLRYSGVFEEHIKNLDAIRRKTYFPKALRVISDLVEQGLISSLDVTHQFGILLGRMESVAECALAVVLDDRLLKIGRSKLSRALVLSEGSLKRRRQELHSIEVYPEILRILMNIADTLANYMRIQVEEHNQKPQQVRRRLPIKWIF